MRSTSAAVTLLFRRAARGPENTLEALRDLIKRDNQQDVPGLAYVEFDVHVSSVSGFCGPQLHPASHHHCSHEAAVTSGMLRQIGAALLWIHTRAWCQLAAARGGSTQRRVLGLG